MYACNALHDACFFGIHVALSLHPQCRCRFYVSTTVPFLRMMRVDDWDPGFSRRTAVPLDLKARVVTIGFPVGFPFMPSCLCRVRRRATEDRLTAMKCLPVGTDVTIKGSPSPFHVSQHQNFTFSSPLVALLANIDGLCARLRTDLFLLVRVGVVVSECTLRSDDDASRHPRWTIGYCQLTSAWFLLTCILGHLWIHHCPRLLASAWYSAWFLLTSICTRHGLFNHWRL